MSIKWKPEFGISVDELDKDHMKLIDLATTLEKGINNNCSEETVSFALDFFREYLSVHFITEEDYMKRFGFPESEDHKREHGYFLENIIEFEKKECSSMILSKKIISFLNDWLFEHILEYDKKLGEHLNKHGIY